MRTLTGWQFCKTLMPRRHGGVGAGVRGMSRLCRVLLVSWLGAISLGVAAQTSGQIGQVTVEAVSRSATGAYTLTLRQQGDPDQMRLLLQPCRVVRLMGNARDSVAMRSVFQRLESARATARPVHWLWGDGGYHAANKAHPCLARIVEISSPGPNEFIVRTQVRVTPQLPKS
jgi:hypothetical protein